MGNALVHRHISRGIPGRDVPCPLTLHQHTLLSDSTAIRRRCRWMRNLPCLPKCKREGSGKGGCHTISKPCAWWASASQLPVPAADTMGQAQDIPSTAICYLTGQSLSTCLLVILIIYSRYYKSSPTRSLLGMALYKLAASKLQRCSTLLHKRIGQTDPVSAKGERRKKHGRRKRNASTYCVTSFQHLLGPRIYSGFQLCITSANNQCLLVSSLVYRPRCHTAKLNAE